MVEVYLKKLDIVPVPCEYMFLLIMFTVNNPDSFQTNSAMHLMNTRNKHQLNRPTVNLSCIHSSVCYSSIKILIVFPPIF